MTHADQLLAHARYAMAQARLAATERGDGDAALASWTAIAAGHYAELDTLLSGDATPPAAWVPDLATLPGEVTADLHPSREHGGATVVQLAGPPGHLFLVRVGDRVAASVLAPAPDADPSAREG